MILPDVNLLIYTYDTGAPAHAGALAWWQSSLNGSEKILLCHPVIFGFLRISTSPRMMAAPLDVSQALSIIRGWLRHPLVSVAVPDRGNHERAMQLIDGVGTAGNLTTDAQIAAIALDHGAIVHTNDADFRRFPSVRWHNPLTGISGQNP